LEPNRKDATTLAETMADVERNLDRMSEQQEGVKVLREKRRLKDDEVQTKQVLFRCILGTLRRVLWSSSVLVYTVWLCALCGLMHTCGHIYMLVVHMFIGCIYVQTIYVQTIYVQTSRLRSRVYPYPQYSIISLLLITPRAFLLVACYMQFKVDGAAKVHEALVANTLKLREEVATLEDSHGDALGEYRHIKHTNWFGFLYTQIS
jgi:hypothetical protein